MFEINHDHALYYCSKHFLEYAESSNVDGIHPFVSKERKPAEEIFLVLFAMLSITFCTNLVMNALGNSKFSSVVFGIDEKIWTINDVSSSAKCKIIVKLNKSS